MASAPSYTQDNRIGRLKTDLGKDKLLLISMTCVERMSEAFTITVEAFSLEPQAVHSLLGTSVTVEFDGPEDYLKRFFNGVLWEYTELGNDHRGHRYQLVLRPGTEFMTLNKRNRIFQQKSVRDIVQSVLIGEVDMKLGGAYEPLEYCVQYQESDFDFVSRLMEFEGIYYFYRHTDGHNEIVLVDDRNTHDDMVPATTKVEQRINGRSEGLIWTLTERRALGPVKVTVADYDFETPESQLLKSRSAAKAVGAPTKTHESLGAGAAGAWESSSEIYDFPAKFNTPNSAMGDRYSNVWLDAHRRRMARSFAEGELLSAAVGRTLTLDLQGTSAEYLILGSTHSYTAPPYDGGATQDEDVHVSLELMPAEDQYRPELRTERPRILGPQTALVTGEAGEEISTDKYGRIKVQFYWDRDGKKDQNSSCYIRVAQTWAGQGWGTMMLPRIGMEVVVEFLDGDPDRPLVTGAVYNGVNMTPVPLPDNKTHSGMRSRSTKGGGGFNHWWFEDKKGEEVAWFRAERDYKAHIVNADEERQYDKGSRTTLFMKGDDSLTISQGRRTETIQMDDTRTVKVGNVTTTIEKGDETRTIDKGSRTTTIEKDETLEIRKGNRATSIKMGNESLKVAMGNIDIKADLGKISMEAMQSIELKVGGSSITIDQIGVKIKGTVMVDIKGVMIQSSADAMQTIKGGLVMIN